ncbi:lytic murein transglycosylase [Pyruvatibacter mobilis]|jgi:membrane-bound lytic murein transglycosylase B|uniref:lytic murein transglycosylase n=1 Tax=Pyruvatibacter mobilis TaxID=1712261 RepID=UPI003BA85F12
MAALAGAPVQAQQMAPVADDVVVTAEMEDRLAAWLTAFRAEALEAGISARTFNAAFKGITLDVKVLELNQKQPEFVRPIWDYLGSALSDKRKADGEAQLAANRTLFDKLEAKYGVEREVLAAIWGLETHYGTFTGSRNVIRSLTTLAFEGRRADFGRAQLLAALKILENGDISPEAMNGSWAGAMGHTQFIPTTYLEHAVDFDGDGKRNIWESHADALASAANYLKASGWDKGDTPVREVVLPMGFDYALADRGITKTGAEWQTLGVQTVSGAELPARERGLEAYLIIPAGFKGPAFLAYPNFKTILRYNNATAYAMAVSYLSKHFAGDAPITRSWPTDERPLTVSEAQEMQRTLTQIGLDTGGVDGIIGPMTRKAIRQFQARLGQPQDGFATASLLKKIRAAAR